MGDEMYRSDNGGRTWRKVSPDGQDVGGGPAYYYQQICINPTNPDHLYVLGVRMWETVNAGKEWRQPFRFGGDNHAMWINPQNPKHMMLGYDHGMGITYDAGINWYHLILCLLDNLWPWVSIMIIPIMYMVASRIMDQSKVPPPKAQRCHSDGGLEQSWRRRRDVQRG
jgi:hypothetical protein